MFTSSTKREIKHFHAVVLQWLLKNVQKSVMQWSCCFKDPVYTRNFTCAARLHETVQILLQITVLFAFQKLARFRGFHVNERQVRASFCPFKNFKGV